MSKTVASLCAAFTTISTSWMHPYRKTITRALVAERIAPIITTRAGKTDIHFAVPAARALHDSWDVYKGEPETIRWIDQIPTQDTLWDIGSNVGVYALYAALTRNLPVLAFEPGAANYATLVKNIELNKMDNKIEAYCLAFDETSHLDLLHMANTEAGHSMHSFGQNQSIQGEIKTVFRQAALGYSIDDFCAFFKPKMPDHIKLDVDGIELKILRGAKKTLAENVKTLLVEIDRPDRAKIGQDISSFLASVDFVEDKGFVTDNAARNVLFRKK